MSSNTLQEFAEVIMKGAETVGESFQNPDDDWTSILHIETGDNGIIVGAVDPQFFNDDETKERLLAAVGSMLEEKQATKVAILNSCWAAMVTPQEFVSGDYVRPRDRADSDRIELISLVALSRDSAISYSAVIERDGTNPPTLAAWQQEKFFDSRWLDWQAVLS